MSNFRLFWCFCPDSADVSLTTEGQDAAVTSSSSDQVTSDREHHLMLTDPPEHTQWKLAVFQSYTAVCALSVAARVSRAVNTFSCCRGFWALGGKSSASVNLSHIQRCTLICGVLRGVPYARRVPERLAVLRGRSSSLFLDT